MNHKKKTPIGGIKFSEERAHYSIYGSHYELLQHIGNKQINIPFLCQTVEGSSTRTSFCVSANDAPPVSEILTYSPIRTFEATTRLQVGSITIFPHKNDITLIAIVMSLMESLHLPVYSFATSISALIFNTQFKQLNNIARQLTNIFDLPENHSPFHPEFQLRQPPNSLTQ